MRSYKTYRSFLLSCFSTVVVLVCFCITTYALILSSVEVRDNIFKTGNIGINLNDGKEIISEDEFIFEPGVVVKKDFFIENTGSWDVYYKLYFENIVGDLADVIEISITDGEKSLYSGKISDLTKDKVLPVEDELGVGDCKYLSVYFHFPETMGNDTQNLLLSFDLSADAVQTKNNSERLFE